MAWLEELATSGGPADLDGGDRVEKAGQMSPPPSSPKSWSFDPETVAWHYLGDVAADSHPGTAGLDYNTLMSMSRVPVIGAIIQIRLNQIATFCRRQNHRFSTGLRVVCRDEEKFPSKATRKRAREIEDVVLAGAGEWGPTGGMEPAVRMLMRDSLTYDQANFEIFKSRAAELTGKGDPIGWLPVDASTVRIRKPTQQEVLQGRRNPDTMTYIQTVNHKVVAEWSDDEMIWGIRRPRTWLYSNGYGYPELEELIRVITSILNSETYNNVNFTQGIHAQSIIALKSQMDANSFRAFRRQLQAMLSGVRNAKRTPVLQLDPRKEFDEDLKVLPLSSSNKDMEFSDWINWLLKVASAVFQIDPAEINFVFGNEGESQSMNSRGPADRIAHSKDKGLRPLLNYLEAWLNEGIVWKIDPDFELSFFGLDTINERERLERDQIALQTHKTPNELRAEKDQPSLGPIGDMPLHPNYLKVAQMMMQQEGVSSPGSDEDPMADLNGPEFSVEEATERIGTGIERAIESGRLRKANGEKPRPGKKWVPVESGSADRAYYVVEVE